MASDRRQRGALLSEAVRRGRLNSAALELLGRQSESLTGPALSQRQRAPVSKYYLDRTATIIYRFALRGLANTAALGVRS